MGFKIVDATKKPVVVMYTDGACLGNPGPGGWGVLLLSGKHKKELYGGEQDTTNNRMELTAAIEGLKALKRPSEVTIYTDSSYVQQGMLKWLDSWKKRNWKTSNKKPVKNADLWQELDQVCGQHQVSWQWVKGHAGNEGNEIADQLAGKGAAEASSMESL